MQTVSASKPDPPPKQVYALLVGINQYPSPPLELQGCVNDVEALETYLNELIPDGNQLHLLKLTDAAATRQAIIAGFREHLNQAQENDVALFFYSGHGAREAAPPEFWHLEPDRFNETLVCYDSPLGAWNLADKELDQLIGEVATHCPHTVVILDCCHSGSGTRADVQEIAVRRAPTDYRKRPLSSYILSREAIASLTAANADRQSGWQLSQGRHILLAACRDHQTAKEYRVDGQKHRGAFSYFLIDTLQQTGGRLTYRDLFKRTSSFVETSVAEQSPQLETTYPEDLQRLFLNNVLAEPVPYFVLSPHSQHGWVIDGGAVHGIPRPTVDETTMLAIFPFKSSPAQLRNRENAIARASVTQVHSNFSQVQFTPPNASNPDTRFKAVVISLPIPRLDVCLQGDPSGVEALRHALSIASPDGQESLYVRHVPPQSSEALRVMARHGKYLITRPANDLPIVEPIAGYTQSSAWQIVQRLEHMARWYNTLKLSNSLTSDLPTDAVQLELFDDGGAFPERLEYREVNGDWQEPTFTLRLENRSDRILYCAVLNLTERFAVTNLLAAGTERLAPGQETWAFGKKPLYAEVPDELWQQGITELRDVLKLVVSTTPFDARTFEQPKLDLPRSRSTGAEADHWLERLTRHLQWRDISTQSPSKRVDTWMTHEVAVTTVRPRNRIPISATQQVALGFGVYVASHPSLKAQGRLTSVHQANSDLGNLILPALLREHPEQVQLLQFTPIRGTDPGLSGIELNAVAGDTRQTVTTQTPLKLIVEVDLAEGTQVLPIAFDGEFFLPLGRSHWLEPGKLLITLDRLPDPIQKKQLHSTGSIYIFLPTITPQRSDSTILYPTLQKLLQPLVSLPQFQVRSHPISLQTGVAIALAMGLNALTRETPSIAAIASLLMGMNATDPRSDQEQMNADLFTTVFDQSQLGTSKNPPKGCLAVRLWG